jgi:hypothetical protein
MWFVSKRPWNGRSSDSVDYVVFALCTIRQLLNTLLVSSVGDHWVLSTFARIDWACMPHRASSYWLNNNQPAWIDIPQRSNSAIQVEDLSGLVEIDGK